MRALLGAFLVALLPGCGGAPVTSTARGDLSPPTVRYAYTVLRIALGRALKSGRVVRNVATLIDPPANATPEMHPLWADAVRLLLASVEGDRFEALYVAAVGLGLRQGELVALRWSDIDLDAGTPTVRHTLERGGRILAEPKTERARRTLRLPGSVDDALWEHHARQKVSASTGSSSRRRQGTAIDARNLTRAFLEALRRAGLPVQRFHNLRHPFATLMLESGEELGVVSRMLGHPDPSTTMVSAHLTPVMLERSAERMDAILGARRVG